MPKHFLRYDIQGDKLILYEKSDPGNVIPVPYTGSTRNDLSEAVCQFFEGREGEIEFEATNIDDPNNKQDTKFYGVWAHNRPRLFSPPSS